MSRNVKVAGAGVGVVLAAGLGVGLYLAWPLTSSGPVTGVETFAGTEIMTPAQAASNSFEPTIHLTASGLFSDAGTIHLGGGNAAGATSIILGNGDVNVHHAATNPSLQPTQVPGTCTYAATENVAYTVTGGTGSYSNITGGHGVATVSFRFKTPLLPAAEPEGKIACNTNANPTGGSVSFKAVGPITRSS
jgi:hypothetical protein